MSWKDIICALDQKISDPEATAWDLLMTADDKERFVFEGICYEIPVEYDFDCFDFGNAAKSVMNSALDQENSESASMNPVATDWLLEDTNRISWPEFSGNIHPRAVRYLIQHPELIHWDWFSSNSNPLAVEFMLRSPEKIHVEWLCSNTSPRAAHVLETHVRMNHPDLNWKKISRNVSCRRIILKNLHAADWRMISKNPAMIDLIKEELAQGNDNRIVWVYLSMNTHPDAIKILAENIDRICWKALSRNKGASSLISKHEIDARGRWLSSNPAALDALGTVAHAIWKPALYANCYWHPYVDQFIVDRRPFRFGSSISKVPYTLAVIKHHYLYMRKIIEHERVSKYMLQKYKCTDSHKLYKVMSRLIDQGDKETNAVFTKLSKLKDQRNAIVHSTNWEHLEQCHTIADVRGETLSSSECDRQLWERSSQYIQLIHAYEMMEREIKKVQPDLFKKTEKATKIYEWLEAEPKPLIKPNHFKRLYDIRKSIVHAISWLDIRI